MMYRNKVYRAIVLPSYQWSFRKTGTAGSGAEPQPKSNLVHFSHKIPSFVVNNFNDFRKSQLNYDSWFGIR